MIANRTQVADIFGVSKPTVDAWVKRGCPVDFKGKKGVPSQYDTVAVYHWLVSAEIDYDFEKEKARLTSFQADKVSLQVDEMKGELVPADDVAMIWQRLVSAMKAKLLSLPTKSAPLVLAADNQSEIKSILRDQVHGALTELHSDLSSLIAQQSEPDN